MSQVTRILSEMEGGDPTAAERLLPLVYEELRKLAATRLRDEKPGQTLQATALVHEAYLRLVDTDRPVDWKGRGHFFGAAAESMRRILVESARRKRAIKHGGQLRRVEMEDIKLAAPGGDDRLLELNDALDKLALADPQAAQMVKLRYFAHLTIPQVAAAMGVSPRTADILWAYARAWLKVELGPDEADGTDESTTESQRSQRKD